ncbi:MAG TPA: chitobiase/beta-hexosaminidase C-terminal domain-containing protein, partial [Pyrinomonadaceae bacterium]|nr:chitobiase/beta-hexosaminidase C-terminal domain-containing protein [Pyrinomonadaceae bacterium]
KSDGTVWGWGSNSEGQLGASGGATPHQIAGLSNVTRVTAGGQHSIALRTDGTVWAWGLNTSGQVGDGSTVRNRTTPVQVPGLSGVTDVGAGYGHSAAVMGDGSVRTWGWNRSGELGDRTFIDRNSPVTVTGALPVVTPTFSPDGGSFTSSVSVTMSCSTPGAIMHFTTNGNDPTENDLTIGNGQSIQLNTTTTVKVRAFKPGWLPSSIKSAVFTFPGPSPTPTATPVWAAVNQPLAFTDAPNNGTTGAEIYLSNPDGSGRVNLTNFQGDDLRPQWSLDGKRLVFNCMRSPTGGFGPNARICVMNSDGTGFQILTQTSADELFPSWSPDGTQITYSDSSGIFVMNADGSQRRRVFAAQFPSSPDWSPNGRSIVFVLGSEIWVTDIFTQTSLRLTINSSDDTRPRFSPDGSKIVFSSNRDGNYEVYVMDAGGTGQTRLTNSTTLDEWPDWSPDGAKIVYTKTSGMTSEIWIMNADGSNQVRVGNGVGATWRTAPNPNDVSSFFVRQHYLDFLSREPDVSGLNFWMGDIENCTPRPQCVEVHRINVSASFFLSTEFQQTGYLVERFYKAAYGDAAGNSTFNGAHQLSVPMVRLNEFLTDTQRIGRGVVVLAPGWEQLLESNKQAYALEFVQTARFTSANAFPTSMTPAQFVDKLNQNAGNVLSASERTTAINLFSGAADTSNVTARAQAVRQVAEDQDLYNAEYNRAFVLAEYFGYLRRNPNDSQDSDYTGYDFWLTKLNQFNGNYINAEMVKAFLSSIEYRQRFGP